VIRSLVDDIREEHVKQLWRHYCKIRNARNIREFWDGVKGIANIIDKYLEHYTNT